MNNASIYTRSVNDGIMSVWDTGGSGKPVLFLHSNSACKETFERQFNSDLTKQYRFIAVDFLGHGASSNANHPKETYSVVGHTNSVIDIIKELQLENPVVVGASLGGHVALNLLQQKQKLAGVLISGTPPIKMGMEGFQQGFQFKPHLMHLFDKVDFSPEEAAQFMKAGGFDTDQHPFVVQAAKRTDGLARKHLCEANMAGVGGDQKEIVETDDTILCVVQGQNDTNINNDYIVNQVNYKNLFNKKVYIIDNAGHAVYWDHSTEFNEILSLFLSRVYPE